MATLEPPHAREALLLRFGAVAAIVGTAFQVAAGSSQTASIDAGADAALPTLAEQLDWAWPVISFGFLFGALLWVLALVVLASTMRGRARAWCQLAVAAVVVGAAIHVVDAALHAGPLAAIAGVERRRQDATDGPHPTRRPAPPGTRRHLGRGDHAVPRDPVPAGRSGGPRRPGVSAVARLARDPRRRWLGRRGHPHVPRRPWIRPGRPIRGSAERVHGGHRRPTLDPRIQVG